MELAVIDCVFGKADESSKGNKQRTKTKATTKPVGNDYFARENPIESEERFGFPLSP